MKLTKDQKIQASLKPGDIIISTDIHYFDYDETVKSKRLYSQLPGDLIMVNNPYVTRNSEGDIIHIGNSVQGYALNGVAYNGRKCIGLGSGLKVGKFRLATPDDPGYMATRDVFELHDNQKIKLLSEKLTCIRVMFAVCTIMTLWVLSTGF